jgi:acyl-CoA thioesterase FadM
MTGRRPFSFPVRVYHETTGARGVRLNDAPEVTVEPVERGASRIIATQEVRRGPVAPTKARAAFACAAGARFKSDRPHAPIHAPEAVA